MTYENFRHANVISIDIDDYINSYNVICVDGEYDEHSMDLDIIKKLSIKTEDEVLELKNKPVIKIKKKIKKT